MLAFTVTVTGLFLFHIPQVAGPVSLIFIISFQYFLLIYLIHHVCDYLINVLVLFRRRLKITNLVFSSKRPCLMSLHLSLTFKINFVSNENFDNRGICVLRDRIDPLLHWVKCFTIRHVEHHDHTLRLSVEGVRDCVEPLLPGCVPNLDGNASSVLVSVVDFDTIKAYLLVMTYQ